MLLVSHCCAEKSTAFPVVLRKLTRVRTLMLASVTVKAHSPKQVYKLGVNADWWGRKLMRPAVKDSKPFKFCLRELTTSSDPRSIFQTPNRPFSSFWIRFGRVRSTISEPDPAQASLRAPAGRSPGPEHSWPGNRDHHWHGGTDSEVTVTVISGPSESYYHDGISSSWASGWVTVAWAPKHWPKVLV